MLGTAPLKLPVATSEPRKLNEGIGSTAAASSSQEILPNGNRQNEAPASINTNYNAWSSKVNNNVIAAKHQQEASEILEKLVDKFGEIVTTNVTKKLSEEVDKASRSRSEQVRSKKNLAGEISLSGDVKNPFPKCLMETLNEETSALLGMDDENIQEQSTIDYSTEEKEDSCTQDSTSECSIEFNSDTSDDNYDPEKSLNENHEYYRKFLEAMDFHLGAGSSPMAAEKSLKPPTRSWKVNSPRNRVRKNADIKAFTNFLYQKLCLMEEERRSALMLAMHGLLFNKPK